MKNLILGAFLLMVAAPHNPADARLWGGLLDPAGGGGGGVGSGIPATGDEFVGPFASWYNVKLLAGATDAKGLHGCPSNTTSGQAAVGDGTADDTAALQRCLNDMGSGSNSPVIWFPAGTYKITATLTVVQRLHNNILGEDPASTSIVWAGANGGTMLNLNGWVEGRINRLTFNGNGHTGVVAVEQAWDGTSGWFDTSDEYRDDVFTNVASGIRGGFLGGGFAQVSIIGAHFINNTTAAISLGNANALGVWVRYSTFDDCAYGITTVSGAGNFNSYVNIFRRSTIADLFGGTIDPVSARQSYSIGSNRFYGSSATTTPVPLTFQGNTILDPIQPDAINVASQGPVLFYDNTIRSLAPATAPIVKANTEDTDVTARTNTVTVASPFAAGNRLKEISTTVTTRGAITTGEPTLPGVQPNLNRQVFNLAAGASSATIQTAINNACNVVGTRPIVHFPFGTYSATAELTIAANCDVQLVGDGGKSVISNNTSTTLEAMLKITGPTKATIRDLHLDNGLNSGDGILAVNIDQVGSRVFGDGVQLRAGYRSNLWADAMDNTAVIMQGFEGYNFNLDAASVGVYVGGGPLAAAGTPAAGYTLLDGGTKAVEVIPYLLYNNPDARIRDFWYESSPSVYFMRAPGKSRLTYEGGLVSMTAHNSIVPTFDIADPDGKISLFNQLLGGDIVVSGNATNGNVFGDSLSTNSQYLTLGPAYFQNNASPAGNSGLLNSRNWFSGGVANSGTITDAFTTSMLAQAQATTEQNLTALPAGVSDLRLFRPWLENSAHNLHLAGQSISSPFVKMTLSPGSITTGGSASLTWSGQNGPTSCAGTGFSTGGAISGTVTVSPTVSTHYSVICTGSTGLTGRGDITLAFIAGGTNFVTNGTFESPGSLAAPWTDFGSGATVVASNAHSATHSALTTNAGGFQGLFQDIQGLTPNTSYDLKAWASKTTAGTPGDSCFVGAKLFSSGPAVNAEVTGGATYAQYSPPTFTTDGAHSTAQIYVFCDTGVANFDDITVTLH